ncbi:MAG: serine/threonine-protein phosphatase [Casimicrobiaceae bacterium]|nr:serine/threonine-protein phosphatase [Casimicrobiaceae bacterium]MCX8099152.1 serine/threonine-protein phosphatase [Casimicrobiaceae bacterium]MDW8312591.1 serine/threonine-protein phosphatase [Burkholderiales bacterium]
MSARQVLRLETCSFSHDGGRDYNEDAVGSSHAFGAVHLFMLADGAGGQGGGDVAAQIAIRVASREFSRLPVFSSETLLRCMKAADREIAARQSTGTQLARMAATFVAALIDAHSRQLLIGNLGDSRCYVFRGAQIVGQSYDHSLVQRFIDAGLYPAERLRQHPKRNVLYASLGANLEGVEPYVSPQPLVLEAGDGVLLCSDGVWELLDEPTLGRLHAQSPTVEAWRDLLVSAVRGRMAPGHDNFSALLVRCDLVQITDDERTLPPTLVTV